MTELGTLLASGLCAICIGRIVEITDDRRVLVDFPENRCGRPIEARFVSLGSSPVESFQGAPVLMLFEDANPSLPIILGPILDRMPSSGQSGRPKTAGRRVISEQSTTERSIAVVEATHELLLRCGDSSVTMKRDGKIVLKGRTIVSRASRTNKIRGSSIAIN